MNSHMNDNLLPANPRFHVPLADGLYEPIAFAFVTETMCQDIHDERLSLLAAMSPDLRERQQTLLARYDPELSLRGFNGILAMFGIAQRK